MNRCRVRMIQRGDAARSGGGVGCWQGFAPIRGVYLDRHRCSSLPHYAEGAGQVCRGGAASSPAEVDRPRHAELGDPTSRGCPSFSEGVLARGARINDRPKIVGTMRTHNMAGHATGCRDQFPRSRHRSIGPPVSTRLAFIRETSTGRMRIHFVSRRECCGRSPEGLDRRRGPHSQGLQRPRIMPTVRQSKTASRRALFLTLVSVASDDPTSPEALIRIHGKPRVERAAAANRTNSSQR